MERVLYYPLDLPSISAPASHATIPTLAPCVELSDKTEAQNQNLQEDIKGIVTLMAKHKKSAKQV